MNALRRSLVPRVRASPATPPGPRPDAHAEEVDENGHRLMVRNGHHNEREVITAAGPVPVRAPRVNDPPDSSGLTYADIGI